ncbi:hypothetical protein D9M68_825740 [compost metagenome]
MADQHVEECRDHSTLTSRLLHGVHRLILEVDVLLHLQHLQLERLIAREAQQALGNDFGPCARDNAPLDLGI